MHSQQTMMLPQLEETIKKIRGKEITEDRKEVLQLLIDYIQHKINTRTEINLNFICTHNSRRSQLAQIWAQTAADFFKVPVNCFSGGVEVTAFNERAVDALERNGFSIETNGETNPVYLVSHTKSQKPIQAFSKLFDHPINKADQFAAIMVCSHADENCPFIPGTEKRIPIRYDDPKEFDGTAEESAKYDERSLQIASEMFYVFSQIELKQ